MADQRRKDRGIVINSSLLISVIILLVSGYSTFVIKSLSAKSDRNHELIMEIQTKYSELRNEVKDEINEIRLEGQDNMTRVLDKVEEKIEKLYSWFRSRDKNNGSL